MDSARQKDGDVKPGPCPGHCVVGYCCKIAQEPLIWRYLTWSVAGSSGTSMDIELPALAAVIWWRSGRCPPGMDVCHRYCTALGRRPVFGKISASGAVGDVFQVRGVRM